MKLTLNSSKDPEYWDPIYKKTLIIIDFQKDFINGSLAVPGAQEAEDAIVNYIKANHNLLEKVIFTVDWHGPNHCSFKKNGGIWPVHCVQYSEGAGISDRLINLCIEYNLTINVVKKGDNDNQEEYGAFNNPFINTDRISFEPKYPIIVCGLAGDYCVKESIKNLLKTENFDIEVFKDGVASIDDGTTFNNFIKENNLTVI